MVPFDKYDSGYGSAPGIEHDEIVGLAGRTGTSKITCMDYSPASVSVQEVDDLEDFLVSHRPSGPWCAG
jgi:hypothetical protein